MPMQSGRLVTELIVHMYNKLISNIHVYCWDWPLIVDAHYWAVLLIIRVPRHPGDIEIIRDRRSLGKQPGCSKQEP